MANFPRPLSVGEGLIGGFLEQTEVTAEQASNIERLRQLRREQQEAADARRRQVATEEAAQRRLAAEAGYTMVAPPLQDIANANVEDLDFLPPTVEGGPEPQYIPDFGDVGAFMVKTGKSVGEQRFEYEQQQDIMEGEAVRGIALAGTTKGLQEWIFDLDRKVLAIPGVRNAIVSRLGQLGVSERADDPSALEARLYLEAWNSAEQEYSARRREITAVNQRMGLMPGESGYQDPDDVDFVQILNERHKRLMENRPPSLGGRGTTSGTSRVEPTPPTGPGWIRR